MVPKVRETETTCTLTSLSNTIAKEARNRDAAPGRAQGCCGAERHRHHRRRFQHVGHPRTRKDEGELNRRSVGRDAFDSTRPGFNVGPDGRDCCGFLLSKNVTNWRVARHWSLQNQEEMQIKAIDQEAPHWRVTRHGRLQLNKKKMQRKETDQAAHLPSTCSFARHAQQKEARVARPPNTTERSTESTGAEKKKEANKCTEFCVFSVDSNAHEARFPFQHVR